MLAEEGALDLNAAVGAYVPSMRRMRVQPSGSRSSTPAKKVMLVRHLLTHTAGFSYGVDFNYPASELQERYAGLVEGVERGRLRSLASFVDELAKVPLCFEP